MGFGNQLDIAVLEMAVPFWTTSTLGNAIVVESENSITKIAGKILQNVPFATTSFLIAKHWRSSINFHRVINPEPSMLGPNIVFSLSAAVLFAPLFIQGLKLYAKKYESPSMELFFDRLEKVFMTAIKIINLGAIFYCTIGAISIASPVVGATYLSLFLMNLYLLLPKNQVAEIAQKEIT